MRKVYERVGFVLLVILIVYLLVSNIHAERYDKYIKMFHENEFDINEIIAKNKLISVKQVLGFCFDTNDEIKRLAEELKTVDDIQRFILDFPENESMKLEFFCHKASYVLKVGSGVCMDKAILACSIFMEKNIPCYVVASQDNKYNHAIIMIKYGEKYHPMFTTGFIKNETMLYDFINKVTRVEDKDELYIKI